MLSANISMRLVQSRIANDLLSCLQKRATTVFLHTSPSEDQLSRRQNNDETVNSLNEQWHSPRPCVPRRALMFVPGNDQRKIAKIPQLGADCICLDCEDGVAAGDAKIKARENIRTLLEENTVDFGKSERTVRLNSIQSLLCELDVETIFMGLKSHQVPHSVHLPKVDDPQCLEKFHNIFNAYYPSTAVKIGLIMFAESAKSILQLRDICEAARQLSLKSCLVPEALVFGADDYMADVGATRTKDGAELTYARQKLLTVAKAFGLQAIDMVDTDFQDLDSLRQSSKASARAGFNGRQVIHPSQVAVVHEAYYPSREKVEWARQVIEEYDRYAAKGTGAFTFKGVMVDAPLVKQARNVVDVANKINNI